MKNKIFFITIIIGSLFFLGGCSIIKDVYLSFAAINDFKGTHGHEIARAVMWQDVSKIKKICKENPAAMYIEDNEYHYTVLHWAVGLEKLKSVKALLDAGMNPNIQSSVGGETPLFMAAKHFEIGIEYLQLLLDYGADPDIGNTAVILPDMIQSDGRSTPVHSLYTEGRTPLMILPTMYISAQKINMAKAKLLIEQGHADINKKDIDGSTAAIEALTIAAVDMAYWLIALLLS